jgi:hypothetical protein
MIFKYLDLVGEFDAEVTSLDPGCLGFGRSGVLQAEFHNQGRFFDIWDHVGRLHKRKGERGSREE